MSDVVVVHQIDERGAGGEPGRQVVCAGRCEATFRRNSGSAAANCRSSRSFSSPSSSMRFRFAASRWGSESAGDKSSRASLRLRSW